MTFVPRLQGTVAIRTSAAPFLSAFARRAERGLVSARPHPRARYVVTRPKPGALHVAAGNWWTAVVVGLNEIELEAFGTGRLRYTIQYWRWAAFALALAGCLGVTMLAVFVAIDFPGYIERHPERMVPGLSADQHVLAAWLTVAFWGFVWPWLLIARRKQPLRRLIARIIAEVDGVVGAHEEPA